MQDNEPGEQEPPARRGIAADRAREPGDNWCHEGEMWTARNRCNKAALRDQA